MSEIFRQGLQAFFNQLHPARIGVNGSMPDDIFDDYRDLAEFTQYDCWTRLSKEGRKPANAKHSIPLYPNHHNPYKQGTLWTEAS
ncbi:hypothetical protein [Bifidobacterium cuniculi]|uniref:Uncharacterized protein n=1 Tax=Bifidobacterium cuniculi TaxID=1688 RepID=A0A087APM2_9BIFI|nr:hypothetical protein [Bifidobacterium cuniculi]KFI60722.1 hypothetical protein BCUN_1884 [Bifidobacterium cuniculi]